jgi:hypothetical protein
VDRLKPTAPEKADREDRLQISPRFALALLFMVGLAVPSFLFIRDLMLQQGGNITGNAFWGRDFTIWWTAGQLVAEGRLDLIYNLEAFQNELMGRFGRLDWMGYPYPPLTWPVAALFGALPYFVAWGLWHALSAALFLYACRRWWKPGMGPLWLALVTPAALFNIWAGHWGLLLSGLFLLGFDAVARGKPIAAGIFFGFMAVKPHLAVLVPVLLLVRREWTAIASAAVTVALLVGVSALLFGIQPWLAYFDRMTGPQVSLISSEGTLLSLMSTSPTTAMLRVEVPNGIAWGVQLLLALGSVGLVAWAARDRRRLHEAALLAASCTFLLLPYGFNYDLNAVTVAALFTATRPGVAIPFRLLAALGFLAPGLGVAMGGFGLPAIPLMIAALVAAQLYAWFKAPAEATVGPSDQPQNEARRLPWAARP